MFTGSPPPANVWMVYDCPNAQPEAIKLRIAAESRRTGKCSLCADAEGKGRGGAIQHRLYQRPPRGPFHYRGRE